jgi:mRNA interferase MazF
MGKPLVGEVVVLAFPQTNLQPGKRRPALVVPTLSGEDLILCQITTRAHSDPYSVPLTLLDFDNGRLQMNSFIRPNRVFPVDQSVIIYSTGKVTQSKIEEVKARLRQLFA